MKKLLTIYVVGVMVLVTSGAYAVSLPSDNFDDNAMDTTLWNLYEEDSENVWLDETNQRLELRTTVGVFSDEVALYLPNNWGFLATEDFSFRVDFHNSSTASGSVLLGVGKDPANDVWFDAAYDEGAMFFWDAIVSDIDFDEGSKVRDSNDGTLYISYNATTDDLYLSDTGYGSGNAWATIEDLLQGQWGGYAVAPLLGGDSWDSDVGVLSGTAYLDNFVVDSGVIVPEPATIMLLGFGSLTFLARRRR